MGGFCLFHLCIVNVLEAQIAAVANDQYCDKANVSIRLDKMRDFYRINLMISVGRVKKRPYGISLLIKLLVQISCKRLSFGLSHHRRWIIQVMN